MALLDEFLGQNSIQLRPKILVVPVFEHAFPELLRLEAVAEIGRHHRGKSVHVVRGDRLLEPSDERLEVNVSVLAQVGLGLLAEGSLFFLIGLGGGLAPRQRDREQEQNRREDSHPG